MNSVLRFASEPADSERLDPALVTLIRAMLMAATLMMLLVAVWLCLRRWTGHVQQPLGFVTLLAVGVVIVAIVSTLRWGWLRTVGKPARWRSAATILWGIPSLAIVLLALSLSLRGTSATALILFWILLLTGEAAWWWFAWRSFPPAERSERAAPTTQSPPAASTAQVQPEPRTGAEEAAAESDEPLAEGICQQLTRSHCDQRGDVVAGMLRGVFQPGERSQSLHVAFCPPMNGRPTVEVVQLSGPRTRIKSADVQSFGVRFDLRLAAPSDKQQHVLLHFEACRV